MKFNLILILTSILAFTQSTLAEENAAPKCPTLNRDQITTLIKQSKNNTGLEDRLESCQRIIDGKNPEFNETDWAREKCDLFNVKGREYRLLPLTEHNENFGRRHGIKALNSSGDTYEGTPYKCINAEANENNKECWTPPKGLLLKKITWRKDSFISAILNNLKKNSIGKQLGRLKLTMEAWERSDRNLFNAFTNEPISIDFLKKEIEKIPHVENSLSREDKAEVFLEKLEERWNSFCKKIDKKGEKCSFKPLKFYNSRKTPLHCVYYHHPLGRKEPIITLMEEFDTSSLKDSKSPW